MASIHQANKRTMYGIYVNQILKVSLVNTIHEPASNHACLPYIPRSFLIYSNTLNSISMYKRSLIAITTQYNV